MPDQALVHLGDHQQALLVGQPTVLKDNLGHELRPVDALSKGFHLESVESDPAQLDLVSLASSMDHAKPFWWEASLIDFVEIINEVTSFLIDSLHLVDLLDLVRVLVLAHRVQ